MDRIKPHGIESGAIPKRKVKQYSLVGFYIRSFESVNEASRLTGVNKSSISRCCRGNLGRAGKYMWRYEE